MTVEAIQSELHHSPFRPFTLVLADGREIRVPHHDYLTFSPGGATLWVFRTPEAYTVIDTQSVTAVIPQESKPR
jgi:hypothetical protein